MSLVDEEVARLQTLRLSEIERLVANKRIDWLERNAGNIRLDPNPSPRQVYELLFRDYMGLSLDELPVVCESDDEVVWRSSNHCPTLLACQRLGLDTRMVCKAVYEKSTQAFVSWVDPQLRFLRSYDLIRPHADHCLERIVRVDFEAMMHIAIDQARASLQSGNKGYGAVVAVGGDVLAASHDTCATDGDPSLHAEVRAIRAAALSMGSSDLTGAILFSTCEPCPMCSSLAVWANVTSIVFGASIDDTARLGRSRILLSAQEVVSRSPALVEVVGGVLAEECMTLYRR